MALVTGYTKERMKEIEDETIVDGDIVGTNLILAQRNGVLIDAGVVVGPQGAPGTNGTNGTNGATGPAGPAGPTTLLGLPLNLNTSLPTLTTSGSLGLARNSVPLVAGRTYGFNINLTLEWASVQPDAEWHIWLRMNSVNWQRFTVIKPGITGISYQDVRGTCFGGASGSTNFDVWAQEVVDGANITPSGSATLKRDFWITDYGVV